MNAPAHPDHPGMLLDKVILALFVVAIVGGVVSIVFNSSNGLALTQLALSVGGFLLSVLPLRPDIVRRLGNMRGYIVNVLRVITGCLLVVIIVLQIVILNNRPPSGGRVTSLPIATSTPTLAPTPTPTLAPTSTPALTPTPTPTPTLPQVVITFPSPGSKGGSFITVRGTASNIPAGKELWLFVTEEGVDGYYPQNTKPITIFSDGSWNVDAHLGQQSDPTAVGKTFTLFPALIDQIDSEAHNAIKAYFQQTGQYNPIPSLPSGIQLLSPVQVVRE